MREFSGALLLESCAGAVSHRFGTPIGEGRTAASPGAYDLMGSQTSMSPVPDSGSKFSP